MGLCFGPLLSCSVFFIPVCNLFRTLMHYLYQIRQHSVSSSLGYGSQISINI